MAAEQAPESAAPSLRLQVASAHPADVGKGVARLSRESMRALGLAEGDVLEISGKSPTAAIALRPQAQDEALPIVRLDGLQRANARAGISDFVDVRRADVKPAARVTVAPGQKNLRLSGSGAALRETMLHRPVVAGDLVSTSVYHQDMPPPGLDGPFSEFFARRPYGLQEVRLQVVATRPRGVVRVTPETDIDLLPEYVEPGEHRAAGITYDDVGGLGGTVDEVREMIELPLKHPELFQRLGIDPPKGVLLHGPPGTGKTLLARAVAAESDARFFHIGGPEIMGRFVGESEERLRDVFQQARQEAPSIIFIDEIDSIAPKRSETSGEVERRIVAQLLTLLDGLEPRQNVVVIGATNRPDALDEALRRPGRFDREIVIGVPDLAGRREILGIHVRGMPLEGDVALDEIARVTYGFVGADLGALAREAAMDALRRELPSLQVGEAAVPEAALARLRVTREDFLSALRRVQPSALREITIQVPDVRWDDVGGLADAKRVLQEGIELPLRHPQAFRRLGIRPPKGVLLFGPPGTGKTLLAKAVAREAEANFLATKSSDLLSKWYGESEKQVARLFQRARQVAPSVIFIDEIDSLAPQRGGGIGESAVTERVVNTLLAEMDGLEELIGVVVVGATNQPGLLDPALLRPGRFDELVHVPVPDEEARRRILRIQTRSMPLGPGVDLDGLAARTAGYSGADLGDLVRRAGLEALRGSLDADSVGAEAFEAALRATRASVTPDVERAYERMAESLKHESPRARRIGFAPPAAPDPPGLPDGAGERRPPRRDTAH